MILLAFGLMALLLLGLPVAFSLAASGMAGMYFLAGGAKTLSQLPLIAYKSLDEFVLAAVPLYILMSYILLQGKVGNDLYEVGSKWFSHLPGGLGVATIIACAIFAAISGSSVTTAVTIGTVAIPEMIERGYDKKLALGLVAAGGTLGILIPPSIPMIIYGSITGESVGELFIAGIIPGLVLTGFFIAFVVIFSARTLPRQAAAPWPERWQALKQSFWGLLLPVVVVGGIYSGAFTPTEAAAVGVLYSLFITMVIYRTLSWRDIGVVLTDTVKTNAMIMAILVGALIFGYIMTVLRIPHHMTEFAVGLEMNRWLIMLSINILLLILGCFLETISIILITVPILFPIIVKLGFDPIWFAIVLVVNMELALITPPVGMNLFVIQGIRRDAKMHEIVRGVLPFALLMILLIVVVSFLPEIVLWLPKVMK